MHEDKDYQKLSRNELVALIAESRKESENLRASLDELNRQTRDIRHRIKNIFQIVTSLLNLQERSIDSGNCSAAFSKSRFRIQMMSVMYEYVYGAPFAKSVSFGDYLKTIIKTVIADCRSEFGRVNLFFDMDDAFINNDQAIPLGLIAVECAMNSVTHAFPPSFQRAPSLSFSAKKEESAIVFTISDNGIGMKENETGDISKTLGYFLINILCKQIKGTLSREVNEGTRITITFPV